MHAAKPLSVWRECQPHDEVKVGFLALGNASAVAQIPERKLVFLTDRKMPAIWRYRRRRWQRERIGAARSPGSFRPGRQKNETGVINFGPEISRRIGLGVIAL